MVDTESKVYSKDQVINLCCIQYVKENNVKQISDSSHKTV